MNVERPTEEHLLSPEIMAGRINVSVRTLYRLVSNGEVAQPVKVGGLSKFFESDLEEYFRRLKKKRENRRRKQQ